MRYAAHMQDRVKLYYLARAGIEKAVTILTSEPEDEELAEELSSFTCFRHPALNNEEMFNSATAFSGDGFVTVSYDVNIGITRGKVPLYGVMDESSKIDINKISKTFLAGMLKNTAEIETDQANEIAQAVIDWRQGTESPEVKKYYEGLELPYENKGAKFEVPEELMLVRGMTPGIFSSIKDIITVYDTEKVNINTAGYDVLFALGLNRRLSERVTEYRLGTDGRIGTEDDKVFKTVNDLRNIGFLFTEDSLQINSLISNDIIKTHSDTFRIRSFGHTGPERESGSMDIECVVRIDEEKTPSILYWYEN
jgi:type II secretory pathway component PulK